MIVPSDETALLVGRVWDPDTGGPRIVGLDGEDVIDLTATTPTMSALLEHPQPGRVLGQQHPRRWSLPDLISASLARDSSRPHLLAPLDLQVVKACGVTFVDSLLERVIEERSLGDWSRAEEVRQLVRDALGSELLDVEPGSPEAEQVKSVLIEQGMWSPYLEVGIGPDPEVFTKAPVLASVGFGARIGIPSFSSWSNPEPELVLIMDSSGNPKGATLGNDVNLRDVEGRSALLLGMAKDNNASSAIGPFIRLFDSAFTVDELRTEEIQLRISGTDGYLLEGVSSLASISRPFEDLIAATYGAHHQYPDGFALFTGTLFAPTQDRDEPGRGFTHHPGDTVEISSRQLGTLFNVTGATHELPPWTFGISALARYLAKIGYSASS